MMPDPNSPTSATPLASLDPALLREAAVRLLAADRLSMIKSRSKRSEHLILLACSYGLPQDDVTAIYRAEMDTCHRMIVTGQVPA